MHYITDVHYESDFKLRLQFEDKDQRMVDLKDHLDGEIFEPLTDIVRFRTAHLNSDIDTVVWENGADMSPDFLYELTLTQRSQNISKRISLAEAQRAQSIGKLDESSLLTLRLCEE